MRKRAGWDRGVAERSAPERIAEARRSGAPPHLGEGPTVVQRNGERTSTAASWRRPDASRSRISSLSRLRSALIAALAASVVGFAEPSSAVAQSAAPAERQTETRRVSITWESAPLSEVLRAFAAFSGASIVAGAGVEGFVTADINDQPWDVALEAILSSLGFFAVENESGIIRVQSMADAATRETIEPIETRSYRLSFARASELQGALAPMLSPRGSISALETTNTLIVSDIARVHRAIAGLLR